jgi:lactoylglutathione lyase
MHIEHIAIWTKHLEQMRDFYETYFQAQAGTKYRRPARQFESYFLSFSSGARLELMYMPGIPETQNDAKKQFTGFIHLSFTTGGQERVDALTERLRKDGYRVIENPRRTGDGYYESVVLDPDGNRIEITV